MKLHEEYFNRHKVKLPIISHCTTGSVLLRNNGTMAYPSSFLKIFWVENSRGPGNYVVTHLFPVKDGFFDRGQIFERINSVSVYWDQYEDYLLDWALDVKGSPVLEEQRFFAAWEMFVYMFDSWFKNQPHSLKLVLFETLDEDNSTKVRMENFKEISSYMSVHTPAILKIWREEILIWLGCYSGWLAQLIEEKCLKNTQQLKLLIP